MWCGAPDPVQAEGYTCDFECYATWYAWAYSQRLADTGRGVDLLRLADTEIAPVDIIEQPWYDRQIE